MSYSKGVYVTLNDGNYQKLSLEFGTDDIYCNAMKIWLFRKIVNLMTIERLNFEDWIFSPIIFRNEYFHNTLIKKFPKNIEENFRKTQKNF